MSGFLTKIAHNNRVSLGPKDIRTLGEVISTEKRLVESHQRLAGDRVKASNALKEWGAGEGNDLQDVLSKMASLFEYLTAAEQTFADHDANFRLYYKSIRTKEEHLANLRRNQASLSSKIESQEKKVSKMKEENKDLPTATQKLYEMKQEMVGLEHTVINEEAKLGDFKRSTTREALSLKLGAMLELAEKTVIISEIGKLLVDEIPLERTEPGVARAHYQGYDRTESHMEEAHRCLSQVVFNPTPLSPEPAHEGRNASAEEYRYNQDSQNGYGQSTPLGQSQYGSYGGAAEHQRGYTNNTYSSQQSQGYGRTGEQGQDGPSQGYFGDTSTGFAAPDSLPTIQPSTPLMGIGEHPSSPAQADPPIQSGFADTRSPHVDGYTSMLSPAQQYDADLSNRSSLAYMGDSEPTPNPNIMTTAEDAEVFRKEAEEQKRREAEWAQTSDQVEKKEDEEKTREPLPTLNLPDHIRHSPFLPKGAGPSNPPPADVYGTNSAVPTASTTPYGANTSSSLNEGVPKSTMASDNNTPRGSSLANPVRANDYATSQTAYIPPPIAAPPSQSSAVYGTGAGYGYDQNVPPSPGVAGGAPLASPALSNRDTTEGTTNRGRPVPKRLGSALGSKHGDIFVPGTSGAVPPTTSNAPAPSGPFQGAGTSGYNARYGGGGDASSVGSGEGRRVNAGAFRRPPQAQYSLPPGGLSSGGGMNMAGVGVGAMGDGRYPSEAARIRDQYYATSPPPQEGEGEAPRFDVTPLQVQRRAATPVRAGTMPTSASGGIAPVLNADSELSNERETPVASQPYKYQPLAQHRREPSETFPTSVNPASEYEESNVGTQVTAPPAYPATNAGASNGGGGMTASQSVGSGPGFGSSQFVTKLD